MLEPCQCAYEKGRFPESKRNESFSTALQPTDKTLYCMALASRVLSSLGSSSGRSNR